MSCDVLCRPPGLCQVRAPAQPPPLRHFPIHLAESESQSWSHSECLGYVQSSPIIMHQRARGHSTRCHHDTPHLHVNTPPRHHHVNTTPHPHAHLHPHHYPHLLRDAHRARNSTVTLKSNTISNMIQKPHSCVTSRRTPVSSPSDQENTSIPMHMLVSYELSCVHSCVVCSSPCRVLSRHAMSCHVHARSTNYSTYLMPNL